VQIDGSGRVQLVQSMPVLRPDEQVLQLMLDGWRNQQLSRNLRFANIDQRLGTDGHSAPARQLAAHDAGAPETGVAQAAMSEWPGYVFVAASLVSLLLLSSMAFAKRDAVWD
jgi:hypothetical protein